MVDTLNLEVNKLEMQIIFYQQAIIASDSLDKDRLATNTLLIDKINTLESNRTALLSIIDLYSKKLKWANRKTVGVGLIGGILLILSLKHK